MCQVQTTVANTGLHPINGLPSSFRLKERFKVIGADSRWIGTKAIHLPEIISRPRVCLTRQETPHRCLGPAHVSRISPGLTSKCGRGESFDGSLLLWAGSKWAACIEVVLKNTHSLSPDAIFSHCGLHP